MGASSSYDLDAYPALGQAFDHQVRGRVREVIRQSGFMKDPSDQPNKALMVEKLVDYLTDSEPATVETVIERTHSKVELAEQLFGQHLPPEDGSAVDQFARDKLVRQIWDLTVPNMQTGMIQKLLNEDGYAGLVIVRDKTVKIPGGKFDWGCYLTRDPRLINAKLFDPWKTKTAKSVAAFRSSIEELKDRFPELIQSDEAVKQLDAALTAIDGVTGLLEPGTDDEVLFEN